MGRYEGWAERNRRTLRKEEKLAGRDTNDRKKTKKNLKIIEPNLRFFRLIYVTHNPVSNRDRKQAHQIARKEDKRR